MQATRTRSRQLGVTLVECCASMTIAAVLAGTAIPSFKATLERRNLVGVADGVAIDVHYARSAAVSRNGSVSMSFSAPAGASCYVVHTGNPGDCRCDDAGAPLCTVEAEALKTVVLAAGGVRVTSNSMRFHGLNGTTTPTGTIHVVAPSGLEVRQIVNLMGRVRTCSPGGKVRGYSSCA